ncbi:MAG: 2-oxoacid:ferredoxin oxidoreductase subunit gamma [Proteobacteria bacterium]|jgi:2-oxoglutarate ferredoxin oxidoreductase subunit gamma|nr:2-oxoacid:ferredoxin oxidoreductase subunit gamma [Pseudomonadota bacterium]
MQAEIIISGFGGQGTLFAGQLLAHAALESGKNVLWIPSYGPEMRGGKARCTVIISDDDIGAPVVRNPSAAIVLNIPSMDGFEPLIKPGGTLVVNSSLIPRKSERTDINAIHLAATDMATEIGNVRLANVICLGALVEATGIVELEAVKTALDKQLPKRHRKLLGINFEAMQKGADLVTA